MRFKSDTMQENDNGMLFASLLFSVAVVSLILKLTFTFWLCMVKPRREQPEFEEITEFGLAGQSNEAQED